jgi:hypothetical protein
MQCILCFPDGMTFDGKKIHCNIIVFFEQMVLCRIAMHLIYVMGYMVYYISITCILIATSLSNHQHSVNIVFSLTNWICLTCFAFYNWQRDGASVQHVLSSNRVHSLLAQSPSWLFKYKNIRFGLHLGIFGWLNHLYQYIRACICSVPPLVGLEILFS